MNRDQVKGTAKDVAGKVQRKVGELTGNRTQQAKGAAKQIEGKVQKGGGNVEQARQGRQENPLRDRAHVEGSRPRRMRTANGR